MTFTLPKAVFSGLVLIALAIYSGRSSVPLNAHQEQQEILVRLGALIANWHDDHEERIEDLEDEIISMDKEISWMQTNMRGHSH